MMLLSLASVVLLQLAGAHAPTLDRSTMVDMAGGTYERGTTLDSPVGRYGDGWYINEQPAHTVTVDAFSLDRNEVSLGEYALFLTWSCGETCFDERMNIDRVPNGYRAVEGFEGHPVNYVGWLDAKRYCRWAGKRLPTEAEWEFSAQGPDDRAWPWDREGGPACASTPYSFEGGRCGHMTVTIEGTTASRTDDGLSGLGGNVSEWVSDWSAPYGAEAKDNPLGPPSGDLKVIRGGGLLSNRLELKPRARRNANPETRSLDIGFRCAWSDDLSDPPQLVRGELSQAEGEPDNPLATRPPQSRSLVVMNDLSNPGAVFVHDAALYVAHADGVTLRTTNDVDMTHEEPRVSQWLTDDIAVLGVDVESEAIWLIDDTEARVIHNCPGIVSATILENDIIWTDGQNIFREAGEDESAPLVQGRSNINALSTWNDQLWWTEKNGPRLMSLSADAPEPEQHFGPPDIRGPLVLTVGPSNDDGILPMTVGLESWPYSGLLCRYNINSGRLNCNSHGPPKATGLQFYEDQLVWQTQFGIVALSGGSAYQFISDPILAGDFHLNESNLWVSDRRGGQVLRIELDVEEEN